MTLAEVAQGDSVPLFSPNLGWAPGCAPLGFLRLAQPNRYFDNEVPRPPFLCVLMGPRGLQLSLCLPGPIPTGISIMECRGRHFCARLWDPRGFPGYIAFPTQPALLGSPLSSRGRRFCACSWVPVVGVVRNPVPPPWLSVHGSVVGGARARPLARPVLRKAWPALFPVSTSEALGRAPFPGGCGAGVWQASHCRRHFPTGLPGRGLFGLVGCPMGMG